MTTSGMRDSLSGLNASILTGQYGLTTSSAYSSPVTLTDGVGAIVENGEIDINASYRVRFTLADAFMVIEKVVYENTAVYTVFFRQSIPSA